MREVVETPQFRRAFRRFVRRNPALRERITQTLRWMSEDVFAPALGAHKLGGELYGLMACSCGYDCRIIFSVELDAERREVILLYTLGTHDEVY
jgi:mRNA-degrading endonuclease YafQ of YafQ-DinJ toxin-antitoxin module